MTKLMRLSKLAPLVGLQYQQLAALAEQHSFPPVRARRGVVRLYESTEILNWYAEFVLRRNRARIPKRAILNTSPIVDDDSLIDSLSTDH